MLRMTWGSSIVASRRMRPPQRGQAGEHVEVEAATHQVGRPLGAGLAGSLATELGDLRRGGVGHGVRQGDPRALIGDGASGNGARGPRGRARE
jgi:hypothetical protein